MVICVLLEIFVESGIHGYLRGFSPSSLVLLWCNGCLFTPGSVWTGVMCEVVSAVAIVPCSTWEGKPQGYDADVVRGVHTELCASWLWVPGHMMCHMLSLVSGHDEDLIVRLRGDRYAERPPLC
jgi:hypothetical protein